MMRHSFHLRQVKSLVSMLKLNQQRFGLRQHRHTHNYCWGQQNQKHIIYVRPLMYYAVRSFPSIKATAPRCLSTVSSIADTSVGIQVNVDTTTPITKNSVDTYTNTADPKQAGEDFYQQYVLVWNEVEKLKEDQERMKSEKMFEAWARTQPRLPEEESEATIDHTTSTPKVVSSPSSNNNNTNRNKNAGGVAVVRTLAREVSKNRDADPIQKLQKRATNLLHIAGIKYKHPKALIELANIELQRVGEEASLSLSKQSDLVLTNAWIRDNVRPCLQYYEIAGDTGASEGYYNLAHIYWDGIHGIIEPDRHIAMTYMQKAIHLGDIDAMYFVGLHRLGHRSEYRLDQLQKALVWIEHAAEHKHGGALQCLAVLYKRGFKELNIPPCSDEEFQQRLALAIEHDDNGNAYWLRALSYSEGSHGYPMDIALWFNDMVKAAELGHGNACLNAGVALFQGFPGKVEKDQARAFQYYQRAGELGTIEGWRNVVDCYATGQGVKQNIEMAKYIGDTMIRPYDEAIQNNNGTIEEDNEEAFDDNNETIVNKDTVSEEGKIKADEK